MRRLAADTDYGQRPKSVGLPPLRCSPSTVGVFGLRRYGVRLAPECCSTSTEIHTTTAQRSRAWIRARAETLDAARQDLRRQSCMREVTIGIEFNRAAGCAQQCPTLPRPDAAVPSALEGLTTEFGMGSGVPPPQ